MLENLLRFILGKRILVVRQDDGVKIIEKDGYIIISAIHPEDVRWMGRV